MTKSDKVLVFDIGGVLLDWNHRHLYRKLIPNEDEVERFLIEIGFAEWNAGIDSGRPFSEAVAELCERFPARADLIRAFDERWDESIAGMIQPTVHILRGLKANRYPLYALSNWSAETFHRVRVKYPFLDWFELILISGEARINKPDPGIFRLLLDKIGRSAEICIFIDDSAANVASARALGFTGILFESPERLQQQLDELGIRWK